MATRAMQEMTGAARVAVGIIGAPHGVRGQVRLKSFTGDPAAIGSYGPLSDVQGLTRFLITQLRVLKEDMLVATLAGIDSREAAQELNGVELFIARSALPPAADDEFYHADLIGLTAKAQSGAPLGTIRNVLNFGGGDILEIAPVTGGDNLLLPFTRAVVPLIDLGQKCVVVVMPDEIDARK